MINNIYYLRIKNKYQLNNNSILIKTSLTKIKHYENYLFYLNEK